MGKQSLADGQQARSAPDNMAPREAQEIMLESGISGYLAGLEDPLTSL